MTRQQTRNDTTIINFNYNIIDLAHEYHHTYVEQLGFHIVMNRATRSATNEPVPSGAATPRRTGHSRVQSIGGEPTAPVLQSKSGRRARSSVPALSSFALRESTTKPSGKTRASHAGFRPVIQEETLAAVIDIEVPNADDRVAYPSSPATVRLASRAHLRRPPKLRESLIKNPPLKMEDRAEGLEKYAQQCILSQIGSVLKDGVEEINEDQMGLDLEVLESEFACLLFRWFVCRKGSREQVLINVPQQLAERCGLKGLDPSSPSPNSIYHMERSHYLPILSFPLPFTSPTCPTSSQSSSTRD